MSGTSQQLSNLATRQRGSPPSLPDDVVLSVRNVSKKFCKHLRRSMAYGILDLSKNLVGIRPDSSRIRKHEFWALDDISFELKRGECLGLIGPNGSGKTTLLRILAGIFPPDRGEMSIRGRVGALITLGAGFHGYMTGRENIYLNGTILGMSRAELAAKFDDIVDFAEIGDFIDAPVATYSSGMRVRLGFAIAIHVEPDVLLVDEVLAVGDVAFRLKCLKAISTLVGGGASVILVSHNISQVANVCSRVAWLDHAKIHQMGETQEVCQDYERFAVMQRVEHERGVQYFGDFAGVGITDVRVVGGEGGDVPVFTQDEPITIRATIDCAVVPERLFFRFAFRNVGQILYYGERHEITEWLSEPGTHSVNMVVPSGRLLPGLHFLSCALSWNEEWGSFFQNIQQAAIFSVAGETKYRVGLVDLNPALWVTSGPELNG